MSIMLAQLNDLMRIHITIAGYPEGEVTIERSINQLYWETVRGAVALPTTAGGVEHDDFEFIDGIPNYYRVRLASTEDNVQIFTTSGTWTKPTGLVTARVTVVGGGGAGGGAAITIASQSSVGGGGGAAATAMAVIPASDLGATETVTIGAGGVAVAGAAGGNGGTTTFTRTSGTNLTAGGGTGGGHSGATTGNSGGFGGAGSSTTTGAQLTLPGEYGEASYIAAGHANLPNGGSSALMGRGGRAGANNNALDGTLGGGGGGARNLASQGTARAGGNGGPGVVVVEHFFDEVT